jgi:hypothetical protein
MKALMLDIEQTKAWLSPSGDIIETLPKHLEQMSQID